MCAKSRMKQLVVMILIIQCCVCDHEDLTIIHRMNVDEEVLT